MSSNIQGSKSLNYNKVAIPGYSPEQGTSIDPTGDTMQHLSIQEISGKRGAADVVIHGLTNVSMGLIVESGSTQRLIRSTAHGAQLGWVMRPSNGPSISQEISIVGIIDANNFAISTLFPISIGNTFDLLKYVTPLYGADGSLTVSSGAIQYTRNAVTTLVSEDTVTPANSRPMPVKMMTSTGTQVDVATLANQNATNTKLDTVISQTLVAKNTGVMDANTQRVTLATDGPGVANLSAIAASTASADTKTPALGQALAAASTPVVLTAAQITTLTPVAAITGFALESTQSSGNTLLGIVTETAPASDTASSGLNGRLQRIAQRLTSLIGLLPSALGSQTSASSLSVVNSVDDIARLGIITETAPASDTDSSGLNGRLQRIAQRITSLIALFPTALGTGVSSTAFRVVLASDQAAIAARDPINVTGTVVNTALTATTASLASAPGSTVGFILQAPSSNTDSIRFAIGTTASTTVGMLLEPGRDTGYLPIGANISVCATVSGTNAFALQWIGA